MFYHLQYAELLLKYIKQNVLMPSFLILFSFISPMKRFLFYPLQGSVAPPPVPAQPTVKPFIPTNPPALKHVEQYQQPTLGSQLYPVCLKLLVF